MNRRENKLSAAMIEGPERVAQRALLFGLGLNRSDFGKPLIGIANSFTDLVPGHMHLNELARVIREGICAGGGVPREFHTGAVCDGLAQGHAGMGYSLPSRDNIADTVEIMARAHCLDGLVLLCGCDKIVPGQLMAALRLDIPAILVTGGCMAAGQWGTYRNLTLSSMRELGGAAAAGKITPAELAALEEAAIPGAGSCAMLGTANTMSCLGEVLGMSLFGMGASPAGSAHKARLARASGERIVAMVGENLTARRIVSREALLNAVGADMAMGGSTNSILHLQALAHEAGVRLDLDDFDRLSSRFPYLCDLLPGGSHPLPEFYLEGGVPALLSVLEPLLEGKVMTAGGLTLTEAVTAWRETRPPGNEGRVIRPLEQPLHPGGGLAVLKGNLAPDGAVVKAAAVGREAMVMEGPAKPFDCMEDAVKAALNGGIGKGDIVVVRYEGPRGGPGMREMHMLSALLSGMNSGAAVVTDGRFSGSSRGLCVGHVSPEAASGGTIALVEAGDRVRIDVGDRQLQLLVDESTLAKRSPAPPEKKVAFGVLSRYRLLAGSAAGGAIVG